MTSRGVLVLLPVLATIGCAEPSSRPECDESTVARVADYTVDNFELEEPWEWRSGLAVSGLGVAYECTGDQRYLDTVVEWFDQHLDEGREPEHVNDAAPGLALISAYRATGDSKYLGVAESLGAFFVESHPAIDGALIHWPEQLWVDTTYMVAPFLAELGEELGDDDVTDVAIDQVLAHADKMYDPQSGLWYHGWVETDERTHGVFWGRGNGWAAATAAEVLARIPSDHPRREELEDELLVHVRGLVDYQHDSGGWHTIVDDPSTYVESSGTTLIARGLTGAIPLDDDSALADAHARSVAYLEGQLALDGHLQGVSGPTSLHDNPNYYGERPTDQPRQFAQGTYLQLLTSSR